VTFWLVYVWRFKESKSWMILAPLRIIDCLQDPQKLFKKLASGVGVHWKLGNWRMRRFLNFEDWNLISWCSNFLSTLFTQASKSQESHQIFNPNLTSFPHKPLLQNPNLLKRRQNWASNVLLTWKWVHFRAKQVHLNHRHRRLGVEKDKTNIWGWKWSVDGFPDAFFSL
jgi:hypothetical protein